MIAAKIATTLRPSGCMGLTKVDIIFLAAVFRLSVDQPQIRENREFA